MGVSRRAWATGGLKKNDWGKNDKNTIETQFCMEKQAEFDDNPVEDASGRPIWIIW